MEKIIARELEKLYCSLAEVFNGSNEIDVIAKQTLLHASQQSSPNINTGTPLPQPMLDVMVASDAHKVCALIKKIAFNWAPPETSTDPLYIAHSSKKLHVELIGPNGLTASDKVRIGLYGIMPNAEYGIRTHAAEETFKMLAGEAYWMREDKQYKLSRPGDESYHPSLMPHATKTGAKAFMSAYIWVGDISTDSYQYRGLPEGQNRL